MSDRPFHEIVRDTLAGTSLSNLLAKHSAVVLERIAYGAGATNWFYVATPEALSIVERELRPGSSVSFYFDDRISEKNSVDELIETAVAMAARDGDSPLCILQEDGIHFEMTIICGRREVEEVLQESAEGARIFTGAYPGPDHDGTPSISVILPDADGVVRPHPY